LLEANSAGMKSCDRGVVCTYA